jgi:2-iminobutanoate/2-iminopropanoate deaminase
MFDSEPLIELASLDNTRRLAHRAEGNACTILNYMKSANPKRRAFLRSAVALGAAGSLPVAAAAAESGKVKARDGIRVGNLYFSSGLGGMRPEAEKDPLLFGGDIKEQTRRALDAHKANLEAMGSSLDNVIKVTVFLADVKTEKAAMNEVYFKYFQKNAPARSAIGVEFPESGQRVEIELVAWIP